MKHVPLFVLTMSILLLAFFAAGAFTWAAGAAAVACNAAAMLALRTSPRAFDLPGAPSHRPLPCLDTACLAAMIALLLSVTPMTLSMSAMSGPAFHGQNQEAAAAIRQAGAIGLIRPFTPWFAFSRNSVGTQRIVVQMALMLGMAALAMRLNTRQRRNFARLLAGFGALLAATGMWALFVRPQGDTVLWTIPVSHGLPGPLACFINRNHLAAFLAVLIPVAAAQAADDWRTRRVLSAFLVSLTVPAMAVGLGVILSRGAILALACGTAAFGFWCVLRRRVWIALVLAATLAAGIAALPSIALRMPESEARDRVLSLQQPLDTLSARYRLQAWRDTLRIWSAHPNAGVGANAFRMVYPMFRTTSDSAFMTHAENAYVQTLAESGLIGALLLALLLIAAWRQAAFCRARGGASTCLERLGVPAACLVAAFNAAVDFALHVPLYAGVLSALAALRLSVPADSGAPLPAPATTSRHRLRRIPPPILCLGFLASLLFGLVLKPLHLRDTPRVIRMGTPDQLARSLAYAPTSWQDWYEFGRHACMLGTPEGQAFGARCVTQAAAYDPNNYKLWLELGKLRLQTGDRTGARQAFDRVRALRSWVPLPPIPGGAP